MSAALRLESFSGAAPPVTLPTFVQDDLDAAYAEGLAAGEAKREKSDLTELCVELSRLSASIQAEASRQLDRHKNAIEIFSPVLHEVLALIADASFATKIEKALCRELRRHSDANALPTCVISCTSEREEMIRACVDDAYGGPVQIVGDRSAGIEISFDDSRISLDHRVLAENLAAIMNEMLEDQRKCL